jgi:hypothetical protein
MHHRRAQASPASSYVQLRTLDQGWVPALHCLQPLKLVLQFGQVWEEIPLYYRLYSFCIYILYQDLLCLQQ